MFSDLIDVMLDTETFYRRAKSYGAARAIGFYAVMSLVPLLVSWLLIWRDIAPAGVLPFLTILDQHLSLAWYVPVGYYVGGLVLFVVYSLLLSGVASRMGAKTSVREAFVIAGYGLTPAVLTMWVPVLGLVIMVWSLYIMSMGLRIIIGVPLEQGAKATILAGIPLIGVGLLFMLSAGILLVTMTGQDLSLLWSLVSV